MTVAESEPAPTPAATVVPLRDGASGLEVLMLRRSSRGAFGGMWVFPGGQVDDADRGVDEVASARRAAVREAEEEAGIVLQVDDLVVLSFWVPPPETPRRFATWFFLAAPSAAADVVVDQHEIREHRWLTPGQAIELQRAGEIQMAPPTYMTLWWLGRWGDTGAALAGAGSREPELFSSHVVRSGDGGGWAATLWAGDAGYEAYDMGVPGPRRRLVMDPAGWRVEVSPELAPP